MIKRLLLFMGLVCALCGYCQELPPIITYEPVDYNAENQNWMISQNPEGFIYVANNKGLLQFDGNTWRVFETSNNTIMRSVKASDNRIYTGSYSEFGYWQTDMFGQLKYESLSSKMDDDIIKDEQIWNILEHGEWIIFQSNLRLYFYNIQQNEIRTIKAEDIIYKIFLVDDEIYYHVANHGIYKLEKGEQQLVYTQEVFIQDRVINLFELDNSIYAITRNSGFFKLSNGNIEKWEIPSKDLLSQSSVFTSIKLSNNRIAIGTISDGLIILDSDGSLIYQITQANGLENNTVLYLFEDKDNNLWTGLDNGINCLNLNSPFTAYIDYEGKLGTVYVAEVFGERLYVGTNQGLFFRDIDATQSKFNFVEGSEGQVWSLYNDNNDILLCGHHLGTFKVNPDGLQPIHNALGTWIFKSVPDYGDKLIQGNYDGLYILSKENGAWRMDKKIDGLKLSSRYLEFLSPREIWINHEYKGVYQVSIDEGFNKVTKINRHKDLPMGKHSGLVVFNDTLYYKSEKGMFKYNDVSDTFEMDSYFNDQFKQYHYLSGKLIADQEARLWAFTDENILLFSADDFSNNLEYKTITYPSSVRRAIPGFENVSYLSEDIYLLGTSKGYWTLDISKIMDNHKHRIYLNKITVTDFEEQSKILSLDHSAKFNHKYGSVSFDYSVPTFSMLQPVEYQYKLEGLMDKWSSWSSDNSSSFENLPFGNYNFKVRSKLGSTISENTIDYGFTVNRPWFLSNMAILGYALSLLLIILLTHKSYKRHYTKKHERIQLENQQTILRMKNETLNQEIESKNRELAISTMSIIKKNEILGALKKELLKELNPNEKKSAIRLIDKNLNTAKDWQFFKEAFNNADKDFLKNIKNQHPNLTPNDLRFCAFLRLNLSSKEIAPLLNISLKSVETKRYRLRKKLNLEHDKGLINYILQF